MSSAWAVQGSRCTLCWQQPVGPDLFLEPPPGRLLIASCQVLHKALPWVLEDCHISRNTLPALLGRLLATVRLPEISIMLDPPREDQFLRMWPSSIPAFRIRNQSPIPMLHKALPWVLEVCHISRNIRSRQLELRELWSRLQAPPQQQTGSVLYKAWQHSVCTYPAWRIQPTGLESPQ